LLKASLWLPILSASYRIFSFAAPSYLSKLTVEMNRADAFFERDATQYQDARIPPQAHYQTILQNGIDQFDFGAII